MPSHSSKLLLVVGLFSASLALGSGNEVGNGGNAVVCPHSVELLDIYEAKTLRKLVLDPKIKGSEPFAIAEERLEWLEKADPHTGKILLAGLQRIRTRIIFEKSLRLVPIADSKHPFVPADPKCAVKQLAVYRKHVLPGEKELLVDETIWKRLPAIHRGGLLLHETIYKYLATLGEKDSTKARYLNTYLLSREASADGVEGYWRVIKKLRLPIYR